MVTYVYRWTAGGTKRLSSKVTFAELFTITSTMFTCSSLINSHRPCPSHRPGENGVCDPFHSTCLWLVNSENSTNWNNAQISNTIEGRILQIQKRKTAIIKEAFKGQGETDSDTVENLKIMFGED